MSVDADGYTDGGGTREWREMGGEKRSVDTRSCADKCGVLAQGNGKK